MAIRTLFVVDGMAVACEALVVVLFGAEIVRVASSVPVPPVPLKKVAVTDVGARSPPLRVAASVMFTGVCVPNRFVQSVLKFRVRSAVPGKVVIARKTFPTRTPAARRVTLLQVASEVPLPSAIGITFWPQSRQPAALADADDASMVRMVGTTHAAPAPKATPLSRARRDDQLVLVRQARCRPAFDFLRQHW